MAVPEYQKRASAKYHAEHIASVACRVRKEDAERFKEYCKAQGKTPNAVIREYVYKCIGKEET